MDRIRAFLVAFAVVESAFFGTVGLPADATKDPLGWQGLRLGMTFEEAIKSLGPRALKAGAKVPAVPSGYETQVLESIAKELLEEAKDEESDIPKEIQKLCRSVAKLGKPRRWVYGKDRPRPLVIVGGLIKTTIGMVVIDSPNARGEPIYPSGLDAGSQKFLADFESTAKDLFAFKQAQERAKYQKDDSFRIKGPEELYVAPIEDEGLSLEPSFSFTPTLSRIVLHAGYNAAQPTKPDSLRSYEAICKRFIKDYGEPDAAVLSETGRKRVWRFPKTILTISHDESTKTTMQYIQTFANSPGYTGAASSTTLNVVITYETPESADVRDTLSRQEKMLAGEVLRSFDRRFVLQLQADGDLVLSRAASMERKWASGTKDSEATTMVLQEDGNLVLRTSDGTQVWASNTGGRAVTHLALQNDGNLVLYNEGAAVWATSTEE